MRSALSWFVAAAVLSSAAAPLGGAVLLGLGGCSRASDEADSKRAPEPPPPPGPPRLPEAWQLEVQLDGQALALLTAAQVNAMKPDFADSERRGWRIETLVPQAAKATRVIADSATGVSVMYELGGTGDGTESRGSGLGPPLPPALFLTRRGELIVASLDPGNPFPRYHGKGGQLRRVGDSQPRLLGVTRLRIFHGKATL